MKFFSSLSSTFFWIRCYGMQPNFSLRFFHSLPTNNFFFGFFRFFFCFVIANVCFLFFSWYRAQHPWLANDLDFPTNFELFLLQNFDTMAKIEVDSTVGLMRFLCRKRNRNTRDEIPIRDTYAGMAPFQSIPNLSDDSKPNIRSIWICVIKWNRPIWQLVHR